MSALVPKPGQQSKVILDELTVTNIAKTSAVIKPNKSIHYSSNDSLTVYWDLESNAIDLTYFDADLIIDTLTWGADSTFPSSDTIMEAVMSLNPTYSFNQLQVETSGTMFFAGKAGICSLVPKPNSNVYYNKTSIIVVKQGQTLDISDFILNTYLGIWEENDNVTHYNPSIQQRIKYDNSITTSNKLTDDSALARPYINFPNLSDLTPEIALQKILYKNRYFINETFISSLTVNYIQNWSSDYNPTARIKITTNLSFISKKDINTIRIYCVQKNKFVWAKQGTTGWYIDDLAGLSNPTNTGRYHFQYNASAAGSSYGMAFFQSVNGTSITSYTFPGNSANRMEFYCNWEQPYYLSFYWNVYYYSYDNSYCDITAEAMSEPITFFARDRSSTYSIWKLRLSESNLNIVADLTNTVSLISEAKATERLIVNKFTLTSLLWMPKLKHIYLNDMSGTFAVEMSKRTDTDNGAFDNIIVHRPVNSTFTLSFYYLDNSTKVPQTVNITYINDITVVV